MIPQDPAPSSPSSIKIKTGTSTTTKDNSDFNTNNDTLNSTKQNSEPLREINNEITTPQLAKPKTTHASISEAFRIWIQALRAFKDQIKAGIEIELKTRHNFSQFAVDHAQQIAEMSLKKQIEIQEIKQETNKQLAQLNHLLNKMKTLMKNQQQIINKTNGNQSEEQIKEYQIATAEYNQQVAEYNEKIDTFIHQNELEDFLEKKNIHLPKLTPAETRDLPNHQSPIPNLPSFPPFNSTLLFNEIYDHLYKTEIIPIDTTTISPQNFQSFINQTDQNIDKELLNENLLNFKKLVRKLSNFKPSPTQERSSTLLALQTVGLEEHSMQEMLGLALLKEALIESKLTFVEENGKKIVEELSRRILLLSFTLLNNSATNALLPALGMIPDFLPSLPQDSPIFTLLFSVSLINRISERIAQGVNSEALQIYLNSIPELAPLSSVDKEKIESAMNLGQILVGTKLLGESLGLPRLLEKIIPICGEISSNSQFSEKIHPERVIANAHAHAHAEDKIQQKELYNQVKKHFVEEGYSNDKGEFFGQVASEFKRYGDLTPSASGTISEKTINTNLLINSLATELAFSPLISLEEAKEIARQVVHRSFEGNSAPSPEKFRMTLEVHLKDVGVPHSHAIATSAVLIHNPPPIATTLSLEDLSRIVKNQAFQLMAPQLNEEVAEVLCGEINKTLFGVPKLDEAFVKKSETLNTSPFALVNVINNQLYHLTTKHNENWANAVQDTFTESLKTMTSFAEFSKKLLDPAYQYVRALSILHADQKDKITINIPI